MTKKINVETFSNRQRRFLTKDSLLSCRLKRDAPGREYNPTQSKFKSLEHRLGRIPDLRKRFPNLKKSSLLTTWMLFQKKKSRNPRMKFTIYFIIVFLKKILQLQS